MTPSWSEFAVLLGAHPLIALTISTGAAAAAWLLHLSRLRGRERDLTLLVDERTRLWQEEVAAHARLRAALCGRATEEPRASVADRVTRVLVVGEHRERREALGAVFEELGFAPVFADSPWAATTAARQADADGAPYDLILVDPALEGPEAVDRRSEPLPPAGSDGWRMIRERLEAV